MLPPTRYASSLRDRQKQATRDQIMHAVARKLESGPLEDLSFAEIADVLGCAEATARSHVHRALTRLRTQLLEDPR